MLILACTSLPQTAAQPTAPAQIAAVQTLIVPPILPPTKIPLSSPTPVPTKAAAVTVPTLGITPVPTGAVYSVTKTVPIYSYQVIHTYPHDQAAFTEGLVYDQGILFEGTGLRGQSEIRRVDLESGTVVQSYALAQDYFGEGIAVYQDKLIQLTWQSHIGFIYNKNDFTFLQDFHYSTEGWGITYDGQRLIMSDGTPTLHFLDPVTLQETGHIEVLDNGKPVYNLNELEYIKGEVYANVWHTDRIARINPATGRVASWINLQGILSPGERRDPEAVLNGIAYDADHDRIFVTGKLWPKLFEIKLVPPAP
ncbi:MAG: glutaminyl-peptide cyclotransferase [Chloroflexi bacterium]|nr:glutaminyl-peptide cyclotransferase [Chloroflexota bacterium]